jgi:hypothetical protein
MQKTQSIIDRVETGLKFREKTNITFVWMIEIDRKGKNPAKKDGNSE